MEQNQAHFAELWRQQDDQRHLEAEQHHAHIAEEQKAVVPMKILHLDIHWVL